ncbi:MAG TPA: hypothetical protein VK172_05090 [Lentimicrobium sp.]|nr:hypothetical protein [Lentimicrobium sp.]
MKKAIHWIPRVLTIIAILFVSVFALDSFAPELTLKQQILGFLIHLIPSFILLVLLIVAWKYRFAGGVIFIAIGIAMSMFLFIMNFNRNPDLWVTLGIMASIGFPFFISGILFVVDHFFGEGNKVNSQESK